MTVRALTGPAERGQLYSLLATIFRAPLDAHQLERLRAPEMLAAMLAAGVDPGDDFSSADAKELQHRLAVDFTHIFHGPEGKVVPYECILIGREDELRGAATRQVEEFMHSVGYAVTGRGELPDHISVELAFLADLAKREAEAIVSGDENTASRCQDIQDRFLKAHLGRWAGVFADKVKQRAEIPFYASMAALAADFVVGSSHIPDA